MFLNRAKVRPLVVHMPPSAWPWRAHILTAIDWWESQVRMRVFRYSDQDPHDIKIIRVHITEDFCDLNFYRGGEKIVAVGTWLPPHQKQRAICRALGMCVGLTMDEETKSSVMASSPADGKYKVTRKTRKQLLEMMEIE